MFAVAGLALFGCHRATHAVAIAADPTPPGASPQPECAQACRGGFCAAACTAVFVPAPGCRFVMASEHELAWIAADGAYRSDWSGANPRRVAAADQVSSMVPAGADTWLGRGDEVLRVDGSGAEVQRERCGRAVVRVVAGKPIAACTKLEVGPSGIIRSLRREVFALGEAGSRARSVYAVDVDPNYEKLASVIVPTGEGAMFDRGHALVETGASGALRSTVDLGDRVVEAGGAVRDGALGLLTRTCSDFVESCENATEWNYFLELVEGRAKRVVRSLGTFRDRKLVPRLVSVTAEHAVIRLGDTVTAHRWSDGASASVGRAGGEFMTVVEGGRTAVCAADGLRLYSPPG
jgi:hypothetical protein